MSTDSRASWFPTDLPAGAFTLEEGPTRLWGHCDCCGRRSVRANGFLYRNGWACAVYFVDWTDGHVDTLGMDLILSVGGWGGLDHPRHLIAMRCRVHDGFPQFMVLDPIEHGIVAQWNSDDAKFLGTVVSREIALQHPDMPDVFRLAEHVIYDDQRVNTALRGL